MLILLKFLRNNQQYHGKSVLLWLPAHKSVHKIPNERYNILIDVFQDGDHVFIIRVSFSQKRGLNIEN